MIGERHAEGVEQAMNAKGTQLSCSSEVRGGIFAVAVQAARS